MAGCLSGLRTPDFRRARRIRQLVATSASPRAVLAGLSLFSLALTACSGSSTPTTPRSVAVSTRSAEPGRYVNRLNEEHVPIVWLRAGERVLVPVTPTPAQITAGELAASLDRGDSLHAPLYRLEALAAALSAFPGRAWLDGCSPDIGPWVWRSNPAAKVPPAQRTPEAGTWFVAIDTPRNAAGQGLWLASRRVPIGWLMDPPFQPPPPPAPPERLTAHHAELRAVLAPALASPFNRWRARLALALAGVSEAHTAGPFDDTLVEALATQIEGEWTIGLTALAASDAALAQRIRERLAGIVVIAPAVADQPPRVTVVWNPDPSALDPLKQALLERADSPESRTRRAREWLDADPSAAAWVIDDAGSIEAHSARVSTTIGLLRLPGAQGTVAAFVESPQSGLAPSVATLGPGEFTTLTAPGEPLAESSPASTRARRAPEQTTELRIGIGEWRATRLARTRSFDTRPPGLPLGPLEPDRSLAAWWPTSTTRAEPLARRSDDPASQAVGILQRLQHPPRDADAGALHAVNQQPKSDWVVYIECREPDQPTPPHPADNDQPIDTVRLWLGPLNAPHAIITVRADGTFESSGPRAANADARVSRWSGTPSQSPRTTVRSSTTPSQPAAESSGPDSATTDKPASPVRGWSAWITIPRACIETNAVARPDQRGEPRLQSLLRLGIERIDSVGRRSAWPRALLPWQSEPGRIRINLDGWRDPE